MSLLFRDLRIALNPKLQMFIDMEILDASEPSDDDTVPDEFNARIVNEGSYTNSGPRSARWSFVLALIFAPFRCGWATRTLNRQCAISNARDQKTREMVNAAFV
jgi:hypothetical protein